MTGRAPDFSQRRRTHEFRRAVVVVSGQRAGLCHPDAALYVRRGGGLCPGPARPAASIGQIGAGQSPPAGDRPAFLHDVWGGPGRPDPVPGQLLAPSALAGRPAGGAPPVSPLGGHRPHLAAGAPPGDTKSGAGAVGHVFDGGQHRHLPARGRLFRPAVAQAPVVEVPGGGAGGFNGHRIHSIFHRAQRRRGRRAAEHRRGPVGLLAVLAGPGPVPPADRRVPMP